MTSLARMAAAASLDERQAAAHLLDRFAFGPTPGEIDIVVDVGLDTWLERQLARREHDPGLDEALDRLHTIDLTNEQILRTCPPAGRVRRELVEAGLLDPEADRTEQREVLRDYYEARGLRTERNLMEEVIAAKVLRAILSPNPLEEVMVDFWFNHFYVSGADNQARRFLGTYERDAIRAHVFGRFGDMLEATAKHPAMLLYLDNAQSVAPEHARTTADFHEDDLREHSGSEGDRYRAMVERADRREARRHEAQAERGNRAGLNENYARELLELHTLGVDGGYDQRDVEEVARSLTGWTVLPGGERREKIREQMGHDFMPRIGYELEGDFFFDAGGHDAGAKEILGHDFPWGGGLAEGEEVLELLADHPSTARHLARKLAVRFVRDDPPDEIVDRLALGFRRTGGDLEAIVWTLVESPEFWSAETRRAKIKTPFELAVSSVRALGAEVASPRQLAGWIDRMGQPLYRYRAPTGFPDRAQMWVNAGALLHRMNFGMSLAAGKVRGVDVDPVALTDGREPESAEAALRIYLGLLLPERDPEPTLQALAPMLGIPHVAGEIESRSEALEQARKPDGGDDAMGDDMVPDEPMQDGPHEFERATHRKRKRRYEDESDPAAQAHVLGLILGSPEFQRR